MVQALLLTLKNRGVCHLGIVFGYIFLGLSLSAPIGPINAAQLDAGIKKGFWQFLVNWFRRYDRGHCIYAYGLYGHRAFY